MAFVHGKDAVVWFNEFDLSAYFNAAEFSAEAETAETTTFGASWKSFIGGGMNGSAELAGFYDPTQTELDDSLGVDDGVLTICPAGAAAIGDDARMLAVATSSLVQSSPVGDVVGIKWGTTSEGPIGLGAVLHPLSEDTNTTTGATRTDLAATATGWTAHLHVTAVDDGSWVVTIEDASASNFSDGALVTGATFTAATGATSQRLESATAIADLRRYVRYVATRTGGAPGDGITFALAYSRNV